MKNYPTSAISIEQFSRLNISAGQAGGLRSVNKFGRSTNVDDGVDTDIWDGANSSDDIDIWVAPTQARTHQITSTSANDTSGGTGARTIEVFGLVDWDTEETSETITMNGTSNVATSNQYVIIHRMKVMTFGSAGPNVGQISATADTDATETAFILAGEGQTQMAIYGIPSCCNAFVTKFYASTLRANLGTSEAHVDMRLLYNPIPDQDETGFLVKHSFGIGTRGSNPAEHDYNPYNKFEGPGILKMQGAGSANNLDVSAGFDIILETINN